MAQNITLKSYPKGLTLSIHENADMPSILEETAEKFNGARSFFGESSVAVSFEGRKLTDEEMQSIIDTIQQNSDLRIVCLIGQDEKIKLLFEDSIRQYENYIPASFLRKLYQSDCDAHIIRSSVEDQQDLAFRDTLIIYGDVLPGAKVSSRKDIIVLGSLLGEAYAGVDSSEAHFIMALDMQPQKLKIGNFRYRKKASGLGLFKNSSKKTPEIALIRNEEIMIQPVSREVFGNEVIH